MFENILLAMDGSDHSRRAIDQTLKMVSPHKEEVHIDLVYVVVGETSKQGIKLWGFSYSY